MLRAIPFLLASLGTVEAPPDAPVAALGETIDISELASPKPAMDVAAMPATLQKIRWGKTAAGATRVVFQTDRTVEYLTVELADENGLEVRLLDADLGALRDPIAADGALVRDVSMRPGADGTVVARIRSAGPRLSAKTFRLTNPPRVVVDLRATSSSLRDVPKDPVAKPSDTVIKLVDAPASAIKLTPPISETPVEGPEPRAEARAAVPPEASEDGGFDALLDWIHGIKTQAEALDESETEEERNDSRRNLAYLLAERGILAEATRTLTLVLESEAHDSTLAFADSLFLAELHHRAGNGDQAAETARALNLQNATADQKLRVATILANTGFPGLAQELLGTIAPKLGADRRGEAQLLLARCHWDQGDPKTARQITAALHRSTDGALQASATVLHADCLWSLEQTTEAGTFYRRAAKMALTPHEASWTSLQLGNLARREGRMDEARSHYRHTVSQWPESFYAAQADWFLRIVDETDRLQAAGAKHSRG